VTWGCGGKTALFLQGRPGSELPAGMLLRLFQRRFHLLRCGGFHCLDPHAPAPYAGRP
jgi:hypothetical protein